MKQNPCPDEEYLMDFLENRLPAKQRSRMEDHLADCADCREQAAVCAHLLQEEFTESKFPVPAALTHQAVEQVAALRAPRRRRPPLPDLHRWLARTKALWEQVGFRGAAVHMAVRGTEAPAAEGRLRRRKQFGDLAVIIELEHQHDRSALIRVAMDEGVQLSEPVRVALTREGRELVSMMLGDGPLVFEEIAPGIYTLLFVRRGTVAGEYTFELAGDQRPPDRREQAGNP